MQGQKSAGRIAIIIILGLGSSSFCNLQNANCLEQVDVELMFASGAEGDLQFLTHVVEINMEEVLLGQLAQQKSEISEIQELGKMMEDTHSQSFIYLKEFAKRKSLTIPTFPNHKARLIYKKLNKKSEQEFNVAYCDLMVEEHKYALALFEKELKKSVDEEITKWVVAMVPTLRAHLDYSLKCQKKYENVLTDNRR